MEQRKQSIKKWLQTFGIEAIYTAMDTSATTYLEFDAQNNVTAGSVGLAFDNVIGICRVDKAQENSPIFVASLKIGFSDTSTTVQRFNILRAR
jgi:hypothetical protein